MKRIILAAALLACATTPFAQGSETPKPQCDPKPEYPGRLVMQSDTRAKAFNNDVKKYAECMKKFVADRQAATKENSDAANAAIEEYNGVMKKINAAVDEAKQQ
jgi:hypothetical protein